MEFDRDLHLEQLDLIAKLACDDDTGEITAEHFGSIDWTKAAERVRVNSFRPLGVIDYQRADGARVPMWAWYRPCKECTEPMYAITAPFDFHCRWLHRYTCGYCRSEAAPSTKAQTRRQRFENMRAKARDNRATDPGRQRALIEALAQLRAAGKRLSRAPQSPDYLVRQAIEHRLIDFAKRTARDVMERLIEIGRIEEFAERYDNGGPPKLSLRIRENLRPGNVAELQRASQPIDSTCRAAELLPDSADSAVGSND